MVGPVGGDFTMDAAATKVVANIYVAAGSKIFLQAMNAAAAALQAGPQHLYISARVGGSSFTVATGDGTPVAAATAQFSYLVLD